MKGWQAISAWENLYGYRYDMGAGETIELVRNYPSEWSVYYTLATGQTFAGRNGLTFNRARKFAHELIKEQN